MTRRRGAGPRPSGGKAFAGCGSGGENPVVDGFRVLCSSPRPVVPGPAAVEGLEVLAANNNLDVCEHEGRRYA